MTVRAVAQVFELGRADEVARPRPTTPTGEIPTQESPFTWARRLVQGGQPERALQILDAEVAAGHESAGLLRLLARAATQLGDHARAQQALERAIELAPDDVVTNIRLVRVLLRSGEP